MHSIQLSARGLGVNVQTDDAGVTLDKTAEIARRELDHIFDQQQENEDEKNKMMTAPSAAVMLNEGDILVTGQGTDADSYREVYSSVVQEARYWADDAVFFDEADEVHQYIHRDGMGD